jgi:hypothetical protein
MQLLLSVKSLTALPILGQERRMGVHDQPMVEDHSLLEAMARERPPCATRGGAAAGSLRKVKGKEQI